MSDYKDIVYSLHYAVKQLISYLIISWSYTGRPNEDICSDLTKVKSSHWVDYPNDCNEFIETYMNSLTTTIFSAYGLLLLFAFLVLIPMDIYQGSKSIIKRIVSKQLGLDDDNKYSIPAVPCQVCLKAEKEKESRKRTDEQKDKTKATKATNDAKKKLNESLADNLISFLTSLNELSSLNELYVLLKKLRKDTHLILPNDDKRRNEIKSQINFNSLQIE
jgi:hypothetical protein